MAEPRTVLQVVDCLDVGGTERQLFELLRRLDRRRWRPLLACFKAGGELDADLRALGIVPIEFPLRGTLLQPNTSLQIARMAWLCRRERVSIVHAHDFYSNVIGMAAATLARTRAVASRRDLAHWLSPLQRRLLSLALGLADCVVANAQAVGDRVAALEQVPPPKLRVVPNGIDAARFDLLAARPPDPPLPPSPDGRPRVVMVASMHLADKGHGDLLEAAALLAARGRRAQWLLVSDGALRPSFEARARALGLGDDVVFLGRRDDVPSLFAAADLLVHPSWAEGFPNAVLEAMCARRPVVATRVGGCAEVMIDGETGLLVEPRRPVELADALERLFVNPARARAMGERGRATVEGRFSLDRMSATVEDIYAQLATDGRGERDASRGEAVPPRTPV
jgi:glycosyltransferase involved in cell wall biosynthesis